MTQPPALVFAAGLGTRMQPLTADRPKPLIEVAGKSLLAHALSVLQDAGIDRIVVNAHYKAPLIREALNGTGILISDETDALLETGGGLKRALPLLESDAVFTLNSDAVWKGGDPVAALQSAWDPARMDALLLLVPRANAIGHKGAGDFLLGEDGQLTKGPGAIYTGLQIIKTARFAQVPEDAFSMWTVWSELLAEGRMFGALHDGAWCDVGQPASIALAEAMLEAPA